ncbi:MAG TPA: fructose-1,6-bisphosphatase [Candidatus Bathyarchaeota archaeon]|nr:fructose-1,6-bisphosphatase [Candidatus Bathyarchaeota archaeon]
MYNEGFPTLQELLSELGVEDNLSTLIRCLAGLTIKISGELKDFNLKHPGADSSFADKMFNSLILRDLRGNKALRMVVSEELSEPLETRRGRYAVAYDPLDGSRNIYTDGPMATVFSIHEETVFKPGHMQVAAGYAIYSFNTKLILSIKGKVYGFVLDPKTEKYILTVREIKIPDTSRVYSVNESNYAVWLKDGYRRYIDWIKENRRETEELYNFRYTGSMAVDIHKVLMEGGIFIYPGDKRRRTGKLRLLYEASPMAYIVVNAGGKASTGSQNILDVEPTEPHQKVPIVIGSKTEVDRCLKFLR